jgi:molybdate transport system substrate-binding protein
MRTWSTIAAVAAAGCLSAVIATGTARAADIHLMTTGAVEYILRDLIAPFERASGHKVTMTVLGTGPAVARIKEGAFADLILLGPPALNNLAAAGKVDAGTIAPAFHSRIGLAVKAGAKKPDIRTPDALKQALLDAKSIGFSAGPSGEHFSKVIVVKLGIADQLKSKMSNVPGVLVATRVARGDVEVGIHQPAELMPIAGIDVVGDLPAELNITIVYATALTPMAKQADAARQFVKFITEPSATPTVQKHGMQPAPR